jgi:hypothetical protein
MKLLNHQKRLDDLQRDLLISECESSRNRVALEKKDFEVKKKNTQFSSFIFQIYRSINYIKC